MGASQLCGFAKSDSSRETPNLQFHIQPISTDKLGGADLHNFDAFTPTVANIRPTSRGEIYITSADTRDDPKIKMNYLSTQEDRKVTADGLRLIRKIVLETEIFKKYEPEEFRPGLKFNEDENKVTTEPWTVRTRRLPRTPQRPPGSASCSPASPSRSRAPR